MEYWDIHDAELQELFDIEDIEDSLSNKHFNKKQETILKFIVENPTESYFTLLNIFDVRDSKVFNLALKCASTSEEREKLEDLKDTLLY
jgi:hypothetical protein